MLDRSQWDHLIPHKGTMCLLDTVLGYSAENIHARSDSHRRADNPLRSDGILRAVHLCEYGAQSMAVHGALLARDTGRAAAPGFLVSLREVSFGVSRIDDLDGPLDVHGERLMGTETSWQYAFRIEHAGVEICAGRAAVMLV
ncbi:MAG TPA: phosphotransferase [Dokdonella sp.]|uniref:phosphotransferase n=1 Tax=Dokdonella sp. TaxID=2291710 RepID=UPI002D810DC9|nr:phosphotransferase [Dokdonella sp.]HET9033282.1 phosphotransferase [Dokdonella sp.]